MTLARKGVRIAHADGALFTWARKIGARYAAWRARHEHNPRMPLDPSQKLILYYLHKGTFYNN